MSGIHWGRILSAALAAAALAAGQQKDMIAVKDPATGKLRAPTAEESAALQTPKKAAPAARRIIHGQGGAFGMELDDSTTVFAVATKNPDGTVAVGEVTGTHKAAPPARKGPALEEK